MAAPRDKSEGPGRNKRFVDWKKVGILLSGLQITVCVQLTDAPTRLEEAGFQVLKTVAIKSAAQDHHGLTPMG